jgi:UDP-N-acetyl-D-mannosaminuronate dehydrogenase
MKDIGIIGYGEIGESLEKCYLGKNFNVLILDTYKNIYQLKDGIEILNICIPFNSQESFISDVSKYILKYKPKCTIIHSTIIPGTTKKIIDKVGPNVVHSPVRGVHPNLYDGLKTFVKCIGGECEEAVNMVKQHYTDLRIQYTTFSNSAATELAKIFSTTYYGMCIAFHNDINKLCTEYDARFDEVATVWNETYNEGYQKLGMSNFTRPVLYPPKDGKIGGHCVIPNTELCKEFFDSKVLDYILELK